jgi:hypothetical protein
MGKRALIAAVAALLSTAALASASHQYDDRVRCASKTVRAAQVVARSSEATAFRKVKRTRQGPQYVTYACMRRSGPINRLKNSERGRSQVRPQLSGRFVAYRQVFFIGEFGSDEGLVVLDMRTGQDKLETNEPGGSSLLAWVVKRNGSVGWMFIPDDSNQLQVWKADVTTGGQPQQLDAGDSIPQDSLRLSADRRQLLWTRDGAARSAPID